MPRQSKTRYAILGMLCLAPMSGYDIKNRIGSSVGYFWSESFGQIYPILRQLVSEGLATKTILAQQGKPERHVYKLTDAGLDALRSWLLEPAERAADGRNELLLKLYFGHQVDYDDSIAHVMEYREYLTDRLELFYEIEESLNQDRVRKLQAEFHLFTLQYGLKSLSALVEWCDETITRLKTLRDETP